MADDRKKVLLSIPFPTPDDATLAYDVLNVDKELKGVDRHISIDQANLVVNFEGDDYKVLRVSVNGFLKNLILVTKTMSVFHIN